MKLNKLLIALVLLIVFTNCKEKESNCQPPSKLSYIIIKEVEIARDEYPNCCKYIIDNGTSKESINLSSFIDSAGKFEVYDTIYFVKK